MLGIKIVVGIFSFVFLASLIVFATLALWLRVQDALSVARGPNKR